MTNWMNILIIGAVILVGIFFVLPMLGSSTSGKGGGGIAGGAETTPSGDIGQGGILPKEEATGGTNIYYVPGTGANTSVAPKEYTPTSTPSSSYSSYTGISKSVGGVLHYDPYVPMVTQTTSPISKSVGGVLHYDPYVPMVQQSSGITSGGAGSGKSNTQNLATSNLGKAQVQATSTGVTKGTVWVGNKSYQVSNSKVVTK